LIDAANYEVTETLKKGALVKIRSIRPEDKEKISEAFRNLESESIYTRFFQHKKDLSEKELKGATEVDFENVVALVVTIGEGDNEIVIGGGRYVIMDNVAATERRGCLYGRGRLPRPGNCRPLAAALGPELGEKRECMTSWRRCFLKTRPCWLFFHAQVFPWKNIMKKALCM
jgi:hypothetical protein